MFIKVQQNKVPPDWHIKKKPGMLEYMSNFVKFLKQAENLESRTIVEK